MVQKRKSQAVANAPVKKRKQAPTAKASKSSKPKRVVDANSLAWKPVDLPEMFNDAEGFFGLEEISGVDVVRNGNVVKFVTADDAPTTAEDAGDDFEGFGDEPVETPTREENNESSPSEPVATTATESKTKNDDTKEAQETQKKDKKQQQKKKNKNQSISETEEDQELESNVFASAKDAVVDDAGEDVDMSKWSKLDLSPQMIACLARLKFTKPTDIQSAAIRKITAGHDVIGKASTGSGKTLAFAIPIVEAWLSRHGEVKSGDKKSPIGLIMSPTRELAHQITNHIKALCEGLTTPPYICSVTGGLSVHKQQRQLEKADIVIGTPGRLWEVLSSSTALLDSFKRVSFLVVDEADRLLTDGHFKEAEDILKAIDRMEVDEDDEGPELFPRQTLVFSATFNKNLQQKLAGKGKSNLMDTQESMEYLLKKLNFREEKPKFVDVNPVAQMAQGLKEGLVECGAMEKDLYLYSLILLQPTQRILVFSNSIGSVRRLLPMLQNLSLPVHALHSQMAQKARLRSVERFTSAKPGTHSILLATDVAARGLDIPGIDVVIHYHAPRAADAYVHRSGRTARASQSGLSVLLCAPEEVVSTRRLIAKVHATARPGSGLSRKSDFFIRTIDVDRQLVGRLKERVALAKRIADAQLAKEKGSKEDDWMRNAAEELGVEYDSEDLEQVGKWGGRGSGRKAKQDEARATSKAELGVLRAQLRELLSRRVNAGVSEKYIAGGGVDMDELLRDGVKGNFLGQVSGLDLDD
ncbi:ATP-dependent RNA helicase MAK5 [Diaporthe helianthi]|uniref:ATP-dependent RNA helicase n=1 Tax=Diaporthe helianthi TaxID=158607 RepID=A0A2P5I0D1_DIAHE|nr:ATP-dependent RNA helicase MAK5 [Diaporthe helianthi]